MFKVVEIEDGGDLGIYIGKQLVLQISQVSDDECINLYFYPKGKDSTIFESNLAKVAPENGCTHELLVNRNP